jgi:hypothetical protein
MLWIIGWIIGAIIFVVFVMPVLIQVASAWNRWLERHIGRR